MNASNGNDATLGDRAFAALQYALPKHLMSRTIYALTRSEKPWVRDRILKIFLNSFRIDMTEAVQEDPYAYPSFNSFFTRALKPNARPIDTGASAFVSPVDGTLSQSGIIRETSILQAKGRDYSVHELLGGGCDRTKHYLGGSFACIYLAPYNYHRIHMPFAGTVRETIYVPGDLFSVNAATARTVPRLFARNERLVCHFDSERGPFSMVFVGALHVGSLETTWCGEVNPPPRWNKQTIAIEQGIGTALAKGAEAGRFNMGSTVIIVAPAGFLEWAPTMQLGNTVRMGERIAELLPPR